MALVATILALMLLGFGLIVAGVGLYLGTAAALTAAGVFAIVSAILLQRGAVNG